MTHDEIVALKQKITDLLVEKKLKPLFLVCQKEDGTPVAIPFVPISDELALTVERSSNSLHNLIEERRSSFEYANSLVEAMFKGPV